MSELNEQKLDELNKSIHNLTQVIESKFLNEDTVGAAEPNVATTDENLSVDSMYQQTKLPSLARQIFSVVPIHGPTGALFNIRHKDGTNDFELVRNEVEVYPSDSIDTGITQEAIQDIRAQYGLEANNIIGKLLRSLANNQENTKCLEFLDSKSKSVSALSVSGTKNAESVLFEMIQKVYTLVIQANSKHQKTFGAYVVLPFSLAAPAPTLNKYLGGEPISPEGLFLARNGLVNVYMNPDPTNTNTVYVGLYCKEDAGKSAAVFSPYTDTIVEAPNPVNGNINYHIYNRFAITESPLHVTDDEMMFKFVVNQPS